jgi:hypothetical protein
MFVILFGMLCRRQQGRRRECRREVASIVPLRSSRLQCLENDTRQGIYREAHDEVFALAFLSIIHQ